MAWRAVSLPPGASHILCSTRDPVDGHLHWCPTNYYTCHATPRAQTKLKHLFGIPLSYSRLSYSRTTYTDGRGDDGENTKAEARGLRAQLRAARVQHARA